MNRSANQHAVTQALNLRATGQREAAAQLIARLIAAEPDCDDHKVLFADVCAGLWLQQFDPLVKAALLACFRAPEKFDLVRLYTTWITLLFTDPDCASIHALADQTDHGEAALFVWLDGASRDDLAFLDQPLFRDGLRLLLICNPFMEDLLTKLRAWLCYNSRRLADDGALSAFEPFLIALAQQCHFNEYVFAQSDAELTVIAAIVDDGIPVGDSARALLALVGCYHSLARAFPNEAAQLAALARTSGPFANLIKMQVLDPREEAGITAGLRRFGSFENAVTRAVQGQYEDNPYPRWISVDAYPPIDERGPEFVAARAQPRDVLIAGCGTGKQVFNTLVNFPAARITAIDISSASLAYARRKVAEAGLADRVDFIQADILGMADWPGQFDSIECVGVLHHMEDPLHGWRVLTDRLKPGGMFRVGLYSAAARADVVAGQGIVQRLGLPPTPDGIRAFRVHIFSLPPDDQLRASLLSLADFFTMSAARDLFFHVQEHRLDLPQIAEMLHQMGLECTGFMVEDPAAAQRFDAMFPHDPLRASMANWHRFEQDFPATFLGMYQFWCQKAA